MIARGPTDFPTPPRVARWLLALRVPLREREFLFGDLAEGYAAQRKEYGQRHARLWYWRQTMSVLRMPLPASAQRPLTITPIQALFSMNSQFIHETAGIWAKRLIQDHPTQQQRIMMVYRTALGRPATKEEISSSHQYLLSAQKLLNSSGVAANDQPSQALSSYLRALLSSNEFLFVE